MHLPIDDLGIGHGIGEVKLPLHSGQAGIPAECLVDSLRELEDAT